MQRVFPLGTLQIVIARSPLVWVEPLQITEFAQGRANFQNSLQPIRSLEIPWNGRNQRSDWLIPKTRKKFASLQHLRICRENESDFGSSSLNSARMKTILGSLESARRGDHSRPPGCVIWWSLRKMVISARRCVAMEQGWEECRSRYRRRVFE